MRGDRSTSGSPRATEPPAVPPTSAAPALELVAVTLTEAESAKFDKLRGEVTKAKFLVQALGEHLGDDHRATLGEHFTAGKKDKYADVWAVTLGDREIAMKFRHPTLGASRDAATEELSVDRETLRRNLPELVPYVGAVLHNDGTVVAVLTQRDRSPQLFDQLQRREITLDAAHGKLVSMITALERRGFYLVDDNPENIRVRADGSLFIIDGAAVSRNNRYGRLPGDASPIPLPLSGELAENSPFAGVLGAGLDEFSLDADFDRADDEVPSSASPEFLSVQEVASLVVARMAERL